MVWKAIDHSVYIFKEDNLQTVYLLLSLHHKLRQEKVF